MTLRELKKELPNGAIREIARRTKLSPTTISQVLNELTGSKKKPEIIQATAEYLKEYRTRERKAKKAFNQVLKGV